MGAAARDVGVASINTIVAYVKMDGVSEQGQYSRLQFRHEFCLLDQMGVERYNISKRFKYCDSPRLFRGQKNGKAVDLVNRSQRERREWAKIAPRSVLVGPELRLPSFGDYFRNY